MELLSQSERVLGALPGMLELYPGLVLHSAPVLRP
jgi:hypothetical protein